MRLIEKVWFQGHNAKWLIVPLLLPFSILFGMLTAIRRWLYHLGLKQQQVTKVPVIVIGNIGIGGNGKTPLTIYLIGLCQKLNIAVGVVSRGYGGKAPHYPYLLDASSTTTESGDEPFMIYKRCGVPVAVGSDRIAAIELLEQQGCQLVLADDGLQHYRMARAKEVIVVDGKRQFGNGFLLPAGPLREGTWRLASADYIVVNGDATIAEHQLDMSLQPVKMVNVATGETEEINMFASKNNLVNAIAGIGDPSRFFNTLKQCNIDCQQAVGFVDHHAFTAQELLAYGTKLPLVMTEKDAVKCQGFAEENWWYLAVSASFTQSDAQKLESIIQDVAKIYDN